MPKIKQEIQETWRMDAGERMKRLVAHADAMEADPTIPIKAYYNSGIDLFRMATVYKKERNNEFAFQYYIEFITLFLEKIPWHPEYRTFDPVLKRRYIEKIKEIFPIAAGLKIKLLKQFEHEHRRYKAQTKKDKKSVNTSIAESEPLIEDNLRVVVVPAETVSKFVAVAVENTKKDIETIGLLFGRLENNQLTVSHVLVPHQTGTYLTCEPTDEGIIQIQNFKDENDVIFLGWIHVHPRFKLFLSSVDLHNHYSYQLLLAESIAIVYSEQEMDHRIFRLTSFGLTTIRNCSDPIDFHGHGTEYEESLMFEEAPRVQISRELNVDLADLRK